MIDSLVAESRRVRAIADDYRLQGFTVIETPSPSQLPEFLAGFRPDLIAQKTSHSSESGVESVVVVVKARHRLGKVPQIAELAEMLRKRPDWKLELALVEADTPLEIPDVAVAFGRREIWNYHHEAVELLDAGFYQSAVLTAWAAAEATVRLLLNEDGRLIEERGEDLPAELATVPRLFISAVYHGVISKADYSLLMEAKRQRDALAHGFVLPGIDIENTVRSILSSTKGMLEQERDSQSN